MNYATIIKHSETNFQPVVLYSHMTGPIRMDSHPTKYKARKHIDSVTDGNVKMITLKKLYTFHEDKIKEAYYLSKEKTDGF